MQRHEATNHCHSWRDPFEKRFASLLNGRAGFGAQAIHDDERIDRVGDRQHNHPQRPPRSIRTAPVVIDEQHGGYGGRKPIADRLSPITSPGMAHALSFRRET